jgi:hypothetical protein
MRSLLVALLSLSALVSAAPAQAADSWNRNWGPTIMDPASRPYGYTYGQWSTAWWRWAFSVPLPQNPLADKTGRFCRQGQYGRVFFLGAEYNTTPSVVNRTCRVPAGRAIFFPIINNESENTVMAGQTPPGYSFDFLADQCKQGIDKAHDLSAEIDGRSVPNLNQPTQYRAAAPEFSVTPVENNLLQHAGYIAPGRQRISPVAADGIYLMIAPMRPGWHTLQFHANGDAGSVLDVTYHLWVG